MTTLARVTALDLRIIAPYRRQVLISMVVVLVMLANRSEGLLPALILLCASVTAGYPFMVSDKEDLETLYAVLPVPRRSLLLGHYVWALAVFVAYGAIGVAASLTSAHVLHHSISGYTFMEMLAISWGIYALSISIQYPLFVRLGYTRAGMLGTTLPIAVVAIAVTRLHVNLRPDAMWLAVMAIAGAVLLAISALVSTTIDPRRVRRAPNA